jgi:hypothetical protein
MKKYGPKLLTVKFTVRCKISGFYGEDSCRVLLDFETAQRCGRIATFRRAMLPPSLGKNHDITVPSPR